MLANVYTMNSTGKVGRRNSNTRDVVIGKQKKTARKGAKMVPKRKNRKSQAELELGWAAILLMCDLVFKCRSKFDLYLLEYPHGPQVY